MVNTTSLPYVKYVIETYGSTCTIQLFGYVVEIISSKGGSFLRTTSFRYVTLGTGTFYGLNYLDEKVGITAAANFRVTQMLNNDYSGIYVPPTPKPLFPLHLEAVSQRAQVVLYHFTGVTSATENLESRVSKLEGVLDIKRTPQYDLETRISKLEDKKRS